MCNLYRMTKPSSEVATWFDAIDATGGANFGDEVYPGYPGLVVANGEVRRMTWGFPLQRTGAKGQPLKPKPVNNCRTDKLDSFFWRQSFAERRCLIPMTAWAEAEGPKGAMTCTWLNLPHGEIFGCAGVWRGSDEWGDVYSLVMTDANHHASEVHERMPVVLAPETYGEWLGEDADAARALCRSWPGDLILSRTQDRWGRRNETPRPSADASEPTLL
ncbi:SOS response-associated peptidase [Qipengyuania sp.]|uniref:SOS response-associated peptidase n=1 Tax=Qipengyuania sp. TaxID=2004515 RepID=UPI0035C86E29